MTETRKRVFIHLIWGAVCLLIAQYAFSLRARIAVDELEHAGQTDYGHRERARTVAEFVSDRREAHARAVAIVNVKDFRAAKLSGRRVISLAENALKNAGDIMTNQTEPHVSISADGERLVWHVTYYAVPPMPGGFGTVAVDDETEATEIIPGL